MTLHIDKKYITLLSSELKMFKWRGSQRDQASFRCPYCGDSQKSKTKTRGGFYPSKDHYNMGCFNCGVSKSFQKFLKDSNPALYKQYMIDKFRYNNDHKWHEKHSREREIETTEKVKLLSDVGLTSVKDLDSFHTCKQYVMKRKIPEHLWDDLYYVEHFQKWINENIEPNKYPELVESDPRLVIPLRNTNYMPYAYQGRALDPNVDTRYRYMTISPNKDVTLIYGMHKLNTMKRYYVFEGPIDSMYIPNSVAALGSSLKRLIPLCNNKAVFVFDNEPRNKEVLLQMNKVIQAGKNVVIFPDNHPYKDIGEMVEDGWSEKKLIDFLSKHIYTDKLMATMRFEQWKKV